jgi:hypothetical protein
MRVPSKHLQADATVLRAPQCGRDEILAKLLGIYFLDRRRCLCRRHSKSGGAGGGTPASTQPDRITQGWYGAPDKLANASRW